MCSSTLTAALLVISCLSSASEAFDVPESCRVQNKTIVARLDRLCDDCYQLFRETKLYTDCRQDCFTSCHFRDCMVVLQLEDEKENLQKLIKQANGGLPPGKIDLN